MIVKNPTVDELLNTFPNLLHAVSILIAGLEDECQPSLVLHYWDQFRKQDAIEKEK